MKWALIPALIGLGALLGILGFARDEQPALAEDERIVEDRDGEHRDRDNKKRGEKREAEHKDRDRGEHRERGRAEHKDHHRGEHRERGRAEHKDHHRGEHRERGEAKQKDRDIEKLYDLVREARAELRDLRAQAGIRGEHREGRGEHREDQGEHREGRGKHREGRGEHREGRGDEEGGKRLGKRETWDETRNGARLILAYTPPTQSFKGTVQNTTAKRLSRVRVEVHLSNGVELGPTKPIDLGPGRKIRVELSAANQKFNWWTTHPEHGSEEHGPEHDREDVRKGDSRPKNRALRPLYNELLLLRREIRALARDLRERRR